MRLIMSMLLTMLSLLFCVNSRAAEGVTQVMGWVPAYGMGAAMEALTSQAEIDKGLTRIGLQFWNPSPDGRSVVFAPINKQGQPVKAADVLRFRDWARDRNIKVFLTVYNNSQVNNRWDWSLARRAFGKQRAAFIAALLAEMDKYQLDGIDLDLEGEGALDVDRVAYARFVKELAAPLKAQRKLLTIDSFHSPCANAPNMSWWGDWLGQVDAIHSMGYEDLYEASVATFTPKGKAVCEGGAALFKYSWQLAYAINAGYQREQILMGMPTWLGTWGKGDLGIDVISHVQQARALGMGIALWDLQLSAPAWRSIATWKAIHAGRIDPAVISDAAKLAP
ncbi:glycosyl hydrolase family 18 protein [Undibacterium sp. Ren11W]|uniref:glycosyl hydrolase family 18 protein n=1 Tax=Undibacterium sp. Ren11W TaxID=3413045 RepID=UPI003BEFE6AC